MCTFIPRRKRSLTYRLGIFMDTGDCKSCTLLCISLTVPCLAYEVYSYTYNAVFNIYRQSVICIYVDYILT